MLDRASHRRRLAERRRLQNRKAFYTSQKQPKTTNDKKGDKHLHTSAYTSPLAVVILGCIILVTGLLLAHYTMQSILRAVLTSNL